MFGLFIKVALQALSAYFHFFIFLKRTLPVMTCLVSKIDCLRVRSMVQSLINFERSWGKKVPTITKRIRSSSRGLGTTVLVPAFTEIIK